LIAKDLTKMQVWAPVNEADIGSIHAGQRVTFTVDAYPDQTFVGTVGKVRLNAQMTQNVVTYTVEVNTDNSDGKLLPYLTANLHFETASEKDVLLVANAAVRWSPPQQDLIAPDVRADMEKNAAGGASQGGMGPTTEPSAGAGNAQGNGNGQWGGGGEHHGPTTQPGQGGGHWHHGGANGSGEHHAMMTRGTVWVKDGLYVRPISVRVGITDGTYTRIESPDIKEGMEVIVADFQPSDLASGPQTNPFAPQFGRGGPGGARR
jgi:HlyD family secretion protein